MAARVKPSLKRRHADESQAGRAGPRASASDSAAWPILDRGTLGLTRHELRGTDLFTVPGFLSSQECQGFVRCAEALGFRHQGSGGPAKGEAFRDNGRVSLHSAEVADRVWNAGLAGLFEGVRVRGKRAVGLNPNFRFYRYVAGQRFGKHIDESVALGGGLATEYTLLVYLSGGGEEFGGGGEGSSNTTALVGGETVFYDRRRVVAEVRGRRASLLPGSVLPPKAGRPSCCCSTRHPPSAMPRIHVSCVCLCG